MFNFLILFFNFIFIFIFIKNIKIINKNKYKANALPLGHTSSLDNMLATGVEPAILCSFCIKTLSTGFEPVTSRLTVAHSNQLSYERK